MIQCNNSNIELLKINYVGNRIAGEQIQVSKEALKCEELTKNLIGRYLLSNIEYFQLYKLAHSEGLEYNKVYNLATEVFSDITTYERVADELSYLLFERVNDKSIIGGYLFVVYFKDCLVDNKTTDALGIFKAETKDMFIKLTSKGPDINISSEQGFAMNKMDRGCIIFNVAGKDGYRLAILNKSHSKSSIKYWNEDFLHCVPVVGDYLNTQAVLKAIDLFIKEQDTTQLQKSFMMNRALQETKREAIDIKELINTIAVDDESKQRVRNIFATLSGGYDSLPDSVKPDSIALKKIRLKSVLKLDDNFEVIFHGGENRIETGVDKETGMNYIKLLYEHDS